MCQANLDFQEELEERHARLVLFIHLSVQLLDAPELASSQQANRGVAKNLSSLGIHQAVASPHPPLLWSDRLTAPIEQRRPIGRLCLVIMVYAILIFSLSFAVHQYA